MSDKFSLRSSCRTARLSAAGFAVLVALEARPWNELLKSVLLSHYCLREVSFPSAVPLLYATGGRTAVVAVAG